ncbi:DoxX family protein [Streptomyces sp. NPDC004111]|uniref:DoxX family protein n=1 Tax=Streptomyces sp. NPDC004111 TaxID=3364690 RepID=UPI0036A7158B
MATLPLEREGTHEGVRTAPGSQDAVVVRSRGARAALVGLRLLVAWTFLWPFLDKVFGLGFATKSEAAWINGGSPTEGFLLHGTQGPFAHVFDGVAGAPWLDVLFMVGLLGIGLAFLLGVGTRVAAVSCTAMMAFMYLVSLWPASNPVTDSHWMIALAGIAVAATGAGDTWGLGRPWKNLALVRRHRWLI